MKTINGYKIFWWMAAWFAILGHGNSARGQIVDKFLGVEWLTSETEHFTIHYYPEIEFTARKVAAIADSVYDTVTSYYNYHPKHKVHIILSDFRDATNGFAIYSLDMVNAEATSLYLNTFNLRGRSDWLVNVITHEFAHLVHGKMGANFGNRVSTFGLPPVYLNDDDDRKFEIFGLFRFESKIAPYWWVEGLAQHDSERGSFDSFDDIRKMFLRMALLEDNLLTYNAMGHPRSLTFFYGELGYNQGYAFVQWLSKKHGPDLHERLMRRQSQEYNLTFEKTIERETGEKPEALFEAFKKEKQAEVITLAREIDSRKQTGHRYLVKTKADQEIAQPRFIHAADYTKLTTDERRALKNEGQRNNYFKVSPDGRFLSFVKDEKLIVINNESFVRSDNTLFRAKAVASKVRSYDWSPDSKSVVVSSVNQRTQKYLAGFRYQDLAIIDLTQFIAQVDQEFAQKTFRDIEYTITEPASLLSNYIWGSRYRFITHLSRAEEPAWSPDGKTIAFIKNRDGRKVLALFDLQEQKESIVTTLTDDSQAGAPSWSADSSRIAFYLYDGKKQNIWIYSLAQKKYLQVTSDDFDNRDPHWSKNKPELIYYVTNRGGIYNIFSLNLQSGKIFQNSRVISGAFMPFEARFKSAALMEENVARPGSERGLLRGPAAALNLEQATGYARASGLDIQDGDILYTQFSSFGFKTYILPAKEKLEEWVATQLPIDREPAIIEKPAIYPPIASESYYLPYTFIPRPKNAMPFSLIPEFQSVNNKVGLGIDGIMEDYLSKHRLLGRVFYDQDHVYSLSYTNHQFYPEINIKYLNAETKFNLENINSVLEQLLTEDAVVLLDLDNNPTPLTRSLTQHVVQGQIKLPFRDHEVAFDYYFRNLRGGVGVSLFGADVADTLFADGVDPTGIYGDRTQFTILKNNSIGFSYTLDQIETVSYTLSASKNEAAKESLINPVGSHFKIGYALTGTNLDEDIDSTGFLFFFQADDPTSDYIFHSVTSDLLFAIPTATNQTLEVEFHGGFISQNVAGNDELFMGGKSVFQTFRDVNSSLTFPGYGEFSIAGETRFLGRLKYRFPIALDIDKKLSIFYFDDVFVDLFADAGNAWDFGKTYRTYSTFDADGNLVQAVARDRILVDAGFNVRMQIFYYYYTPIYSFFTAAYGFQDNAANGFSDSSYPLRLYLGIGAGFL